MKTLPAAAATRHLPLHSLVVIALVGGGCRHLPPDAMSAEAHREQAVKHLQAAEEEEAQYRPELSPPGPVPPVVASPPAQVPYHELWVYNPTAYHRHNAELEREHAAEHQRAAAELEAFEDDACRGVVPEARAACPLLAPYLDQIEETPHGAILRLRRAADVDPLLARMKCHWAFARTRHFDAGVSCPLYEHDVQIERGRVPGTLVLDATTPAAAERVRTELRELLTGSAHAK